MRALLCKRGRGLPCFAKIPVARCSASGVDRPLDDKPMLVVLLTAFHLSTQNQARRHGRPPKPRAAAEEEAAAAVRPQRAARRTAAYERGLAAELYDSDEDKLIGPADGGLADRNSRDGDAGQPGKSQGSTS